MNLQKAKRPLGRVTNTRVGELDIMEREVPSGYNRIDVYADTETWYETRGLKPWEYLGKPYVSSVMAEMNVWPCLLSWQYRRRNHTRDLTSTYESGGWVKRTVVIDCLDEFETFLIDMAIIYNEWKLTPTVYFHNSSYDIPVIEPLLRELDPDLVLYAYVKPSNKGFIRGAFESPKYNVFWEFGDTLQYDKTLSINKAGEILGKPKIKGIPYGLCDMRLDYGKMVYEDLQNGETKHYPLQKYIEYVEQDVAIMRELNERKSKNMNMVNIEMVEDWDKMKKDYFNRYCLTLSGHSKKICDTFLRRNGWTDVNTTFRFNLKDTNPSNYKDIYQRTIESNCGGFTSFNRYFRVYDCPETHHIKYYDRNSMYPTIMTGEIPYGELLKEPPEDSAYATWYSVEISFLTWKEPLTCLANEAFGKEKCNGVPFFVLKEYMDFVLEHSHIEYEIKEIYYQRKAKMLAPLIKKYYESRKEVKKQMKIMERNGERNTSKYKDLDDKQNNLKLLMNALYGKLCEKGHMLGCVYSDGQYHEFPSKKEYYPCILTGSYITYMGRLSLLHKIKAVIVAGYDFLYGDTDSVVVGCPKSADLTEIFGVDNGNLGEWKDEGTYHLFLNSGLRKKYALFRRKPLDREITDDDFKVALSGIPYHVQTIIQDKIKSDFDGAIRDFRILFNPKENVLIKSCIVKPVLSNVGSQQIFYNTDFQMNRKLGRVTRIMDLGLEDYVLKKCETR